MKFNKAFTLAEILIVMAVIGVIGALTIPNLSKEFGEEETVTRVKIAYNDIELAYQKAINKYGPYDTWNSSVSTDERASRIFEFIKGNNLGAGDCLAGIGDQVCIYGISKELDNGSIIAMSPQGEGTGADASNRFFVYPFGYNGFKPGTDIFEFITIDNFQSIVPRGYGTDRDANGKLNLKGSNSSTESKEPNIIHEVDESTEYLYNATNWVVHIGNLDYNKCEDALNWETKTTCD